VKVAIEEESSVFIPIPTQGHAFIIHRNVCKGMLYLMIHVLHEHCTSID